MQSVSEFNSMMQKELVSAYHNSQDRFENELKYSLND